SEYHSEKYGRRIRLKGFQPRNPICAIQVTPGLAEHMERYDEWNTWLGMNDCMVVMHDHRGHARDAQVPGHFDDFNQLISDAAAVSAIIPVTLKKFILRYSMGSIAVRRRLRQSIYD